MQKPHLVHPGSLKFLEVVPNPENRAVCRPETALAPQINRDSYSSGEFFYEASPSMAAQPAQSPASDVLESCVEPCAAPLMSRPLPKEIPFKITGLAPQFLAHLYAPLGSVRVADPLVEYDDETALLNILTVEIAAEAPKRSSWTQKLKRLLASQTEAQYAQEHPWTEFLKPSSFDPLEDYTERLFPEIEREFSV